MHAALDQLQRSLHGLGLAALQLHRVQAGGHTSWQTLGRSAAGSDNHACVRVCDYKCARARCCQGSLTHTHTWLSTHACVLSQASFAANRRSCSSERPNNGSCGTLVSLSAVAPWSACRRCHQVQCQGDCGPQPQPQSQGTGPQVVGVRTYGTFGPTCSFSQIDVGGVSPPT